MSTSDEIDSPTYKLRGRAEPQWEVTRETPWHRVALLLLSNGISPRGVSKELGVSYQTVNNLIRQDWFQKDLDREMRAHGRDIMDLFKSEVISSFITLVEMRDNPKTAPAIKEKICQSIINRHLGTPVQQIKDVTEEAHSDDPAAEAAKLEAEIKAFSRN